MSVHTVVGTVMVSTVGCAVAIGDDFDQPELFFSNCSIQSDGDCNVRVRFRKFEDLVAWTTGLVKPGLLFGSDSLAFQENVRIDMLKWSDVLNHSTSSDTYSDLISSADVLVHVAMRKIVMLDLRHISVSGQDLRDISFDIFNGKLVIQDPGNTEITEGSILVTLSNVSAFDTDSQTLLKLIHDIPPTMVVQLVLFKSPLMYIKRIKAKYLSSVKSPSTTTPSRVNSSSTAIRRMSSLLSPAATEKLVQDIASSSMNVLSTDVDDSVVMTSGITTPLGSHPTAHVINFLSKSVAQEIINEPTMGNGEEPMDDSETQKSAAFEKSAYWEDCELYLSGEEKLLRNII